MYSVKAHSQIVNAIDGVGGQGIGEGAPEIVTASRDGKLFLCTVAIATRQQLSCLGFHIADEALTHKLINWGA